MQPWVLGGWVGGDEGNRVGMNHGRQNYVSLSLSHIHVVGQGCTMAARSGLRAAVALPCNDTDLY